MYSLPNIKDGLDNSTFGILSYFMVRRMVLPHPSTKSRKNIFIC